MFDQFLKCLALVEPATARRGLVIVDFDELNARDSDFSHMVELARL